jgi:peptidoglycan/LPS O-acetylase OafA/YrhL
MQHDRKFFWLDVIRGLSAIAVCAGHLRSMIFIDYPQLPAASFLHKVFYAVTGIGHQAVVVFFVLSGFFVGGSVLKKSTSFRWTDYVIARLSRLWIVLIPALIATFAIDQIILLMAPNVLTGSYYSIWSSGPSLDKIYSNTLLTFLGNIFFLQNILTPVFGTNNPLWSLANEFWYYVIFPLCAYATGKCYNIKKPHLFLRTIAALIAIALLLVIPGIQQGYLIWLLGVIVYLTFDRLEKITKAPFLVMSTIMFFGGLAYSKSASLQEVVHIPSDIAVGLGFSVFCLAMVNSPAPSASYSLFIRAARGLSDFSYSLYLLHFPSVILIGALFYGSNQLLPNLNGFTHFLGWLGFLLIIGTVFWWLFERKSNKLREFVNRHLAKRITEQ